MTQPQQLLVAEFEADIESEYARCIAQIQKAKQAIEWATADSTEQHQNLANSEIDALRKYWYARLEAKRQSCILEGSEVATTIERKISAMAILRILL